VRCTVSINSSNVCSFFTSLSYPVRRRLDRRSDGMPNLEAQNAILTTVIPGKLGIPSLAVPELDD
jgi:hypothetical protein